MLAFINKVIDCIIMVPIALFINWVETTNDSDCNTDSETFEEMARFVFE